MTDVLLYPDRLRCRTCRRFFGFEVLEWLYCSMECARARIPDYVHPSQRPADAPRTCRVKRNGAWVWKHRYTSPRTARVRARQKGIRAYECPNCGSWHLSKKTAPWAGSDADN
jgi:hypothetical protein